MNEDTASVYPHLIRSGLEKLKQLQVNRELTGLFAALEQFRRDLHQQESTAEILEIAKDYIAALDLLRVSGFWLVDPDDLSFEPTLVLPDAERPLIWQFVEKEIRSGRFARALRQDGSTFLDAEIDGVCVHGVLHPLKLSSQALGMFCGILRDETAHQVAFSVLALLLGETTDAMATLSRTRQLTSQIDLLDGLLPFCAWCKKVRNDQGYWQQIERYIAQNSRTSVTHGVCPDCRRKFLEGMPRKGSRANAEDER
jgi:hypothetical protein